MLRRKVFIYSIFFLAGIIAGYFLCEKSGALTGFCITMTTFLAIWNIDFEIQNEEQRRTKILFSSIFIAGFFIIIINFIAYNTNIVGDNNRPIAIEDVTSVTAVVTDIKEKDNSFRILAACDSIKHVKKIEISYYQELNFGEDIYNMLGTNITAYGNLRKPENQSNPGCFNYRIYQYSRGISHNFSAKYIKINDTSDNLFWKYKRRVYRTRDSFLSYFRSQERAIVKGIIFGDKSEIDEDTIEEFNANSTGHILAVSGLHVGFLFALLRFLTKKRKNVFITIIIISVLILYGEMTAWSPATIRAVMILGINLVAVYAKRTADLLSSLSVSAMVILVYNPYMLFNMGFQMTYVALLSLVFLTEPMEYFLGTAAAPIGAIQIGITPLIAFTFNRINAISFLINIPIVFLCSILVPISIIGILIIITLGTLPEILVKSISFIADLILSANHLLGIHGYTTTNVTSVNAGILLIFYILLYALSSEWFRVRALRGETRNALKTIAIVLIPALIISFSLHNKFLNDEIIFVSVGQGDCTHISYQDSDVLIDGGGDRNFNVGEKTLKPYLLKNGVVNIDAALVTHLHMDHYKGLQELDNCFPVGRISIGTKTILSNEFYVEPIWPMGNHKKKFTTDDPNENNTVYMIYCYGKKIMITGDLTEPDEKKMIEYYKGRDTLDCDILKVGHHGSKTSSSEDFLDATSPEIAVISVGANNMYGHPHQETLDKLTTRGIKIYRTDLNGAVGIDIRKSGIKVDTLR